MAWRTWDVFFTPMEYKHYAIEITPMKMQKRWKCLWPLPFQHFFTIKIPMAWRVWMCISPIYRGNILLITPSQWNLKNSSFSTQGWHPPARRLAPATVDFSSFFSWLAPSYKIPKVSGPRFSSFFLVFPHFLSAWTIDFWRLEKWYYFYQSYQSMVLQQIHLVNATIMMGE